MKLGDAEDNCVNLCVVTKFRAVATRYRGKDLAILQDKKVKEKDSLFDSWTIRNRINQYFEGRITLK